MVKNVQEVKEAIQCNICNEINDIGAHYCKKCGRNLNNKIEFTDILFGVSKIMKFTAFLNLGISALLFSIELFYQIIGFFLYKLLGLNYHLRLNFIKYIVIFLSLSIISLILCYLIKKIALKLCKKNI